jgi:DNA-binding transcriptional LysR family regulator
MELRHLRYFVAVAEMENVSRAALKLHVSQPALSRQIRDLEDELGFPLLERSAKSVRLTEAGRVFLTEARAVLQRADEAVKTARRIATSAGEELHVGYAPTLTPRLLPGALRAFQAALPRIRVKLHDLTTEEMLAGLRQHKLHLALSVRPATGALRGLRFEELAREPLRLAVGPGHALARRRSVTLAEAARQPLLAYSRMEYPDYHELIEEIFSAVKLKPRIAEEHDGVSSLISGLEACTAAAIVPASMSCIAGSRLKLLPLVPEPKPLVVGIIVPKQKAGAATEKFLESLRNVTNVRA